MCGVAGAVATARIDSRRLESALRGMKHRGPDGAGCLIATRDPRAALTRELRSVEPGEVALLHRRLAILDLSPSGAQPMLSADGRFAVVYNGEIYNYLELRVELERLGCRFVSQSDTEVLVAAYEKWGADALRRFVGMFAFAMLDRERRTLFLARDFFGIKPLFYATGPTGFFFASEPNAILGLGAVQCQADAQRVYDYLRWGITDHCEATMFSGILQLPAAHYALVSLDRVQDISVTRYWDVSCENQLDISFAEATAKLRDLFLASIDLHLRSDVPVGAALSGGIDSSSIVGAMRGKAGGSLELHSFTHVSNGGGVSEERWADLVGTAAGATMHKVAPSPAELEADMEGLVRAQGEPVGSSSAYASYRVFQLARQAGLKVLLDGQGADELFGGYHYHLAARVASLLTSGRLGSAALLLRNASRLPAENASIPGGAAGPLVASSLAFMLPPGLQDLARKCIGKETMPAWLDGKWFDLRGTARRSMNFTVPGRIEFRKVLRATLVGSLPALLRYEDRNSMAASIESRVPFLTPALAEFAMALPDNYLVGLDGTSKSVLRAAMQGLVPDVVLARRDKIGFSTPEKTWLHALRPWVDRTLNSELATTIGAFHRQGLLREWRGIRGGQRPMGVWVWRWCNLIEWARVFEVRFP